MAEKTMHHAVIGADTFELVDQSARADVSDLKNALDSDSVVSYTRILELTGKIELPFRQYRGSTNYQEICRLDIEAGKQYQFEFELESASSSSVYFYILDEAGNYVESNGSVASISSGNTKTVLSKTFLSSHNNVSIALKDSNKQISLSATVSIPTSTIHDIEERLTLLDGDIDISFELGGISYNSTERSIHHMNSTSRVRIVGDKIRLNRGTVIDTDPGCLFYLYEYINGEWINLKSWKSTFTVSETADYNIMIRFDPETDISDISSLVEKLHIEIYDVPIQFVKLESALNEQEAELDDIKKDIFDLTGEVEIKNVEVPSDNTYVTLATVDLTAGTDYTLTVKIIEAVSSPLYYYLLDQNGNFIGASGSLGSIPAGGTIGQRTVRLETDYKNVRFAVRCHAAAVIATASITFDKENAAGYSVPDYYFSNSYLTNKINRINELAEEAGGNGDVFFFITDEHLNQNQKNSYALIKYISDRTHIKRLFDGGDGYDGGNDEYAKIIRRVITGETHFCMGNHEWLGPTSGGELYYKYDSQNNNQIGNPDRHYYYVDDAQVKTRYVVLSAYGEPEQDQGYSGAHKGYEADQVRWLTDVALNVDAGWTIILIGHAFWYGNFTNHTWVLLEHAQPIIQAIDSYDGNGKIAFIMQGHLHADGINYTPGGIPVIATTSDKNGHWILDGTDMEPFLDVRVTGTTTEQAFDVVIHNKSTKTIHCVRIGGFATFDGSGMEDLISAGERVITYS